MQNEEEQLSCTAKSQRQRHLNGAVRLGNVAKELLENQISPKQARFGSIPEVWNQLLPDELRRHCKIAGISSGQLKVSVDLPAYMYELQLCSSELLSELQQQCPRAHIKKIKFVVGSHSRT
jgi:predicted nucleic acid-binding Zn ribbon protein